MKMVGDRAESCGNLVKITVGGREWYYQMFYKGAGEVDFVRLYDAGGAPLRDYKSLNRLTGSLGMVVRRQKEAKTKEAKGVAEKMYKPRGDVERGISKAEKDAVRASIVNKLDDIKGERTIAEFSDDVGLGYSVIRGYLNGGVVPSVFAVKRIAERCGVSADDILGADVKTQK